MQINFQTFGGGRKLVKNADFVRTKAFQTLRNFSYVIITKFTYNQRDIILNKVIQKHNNDFRVFDTFN